MFLGVPIVLFLGASAWRVANLFVHENGPFHMFARIKKFAAKSRARWVRRFGLVELVNCEYCLSIWIGIVFSVGYLLLRDAFLYVILPLAISTVVIVIKHIVFLIKSIDTRFDQQNQIHRSIEATMKKEFSGGFNVREEFVKLNEELTQKGDI